MDTPALEGLLVIDKPRGITSRAAVDRAQRWVPRGTRIGHTGTLDPLATGVLVLCIGVATRLAEFVQQMPKTYRADLHLGARSDTDDAEGTVTSVEVISIPTAEEVTQALQSFTGETDQVPPNYSAAKVTGRRAYALARRGRPVTLSAHKITIHGIDIIAYDYPRLEIEVRCGKGTYIRSLARDLGQKLGCGAYIETLRRTQVGPFRADDAVSLEADAATALSTLLPLTAAVANMPHIVVDQEAVAEICHGCAISLPNPCGPATSSGSSPCAALNRDGQLVAVGNYDAGRFSPDKVILKQ